MKVKKMTNSQEKVSSGTPSLDKILGGGFNRGDTILVAGQPGAGKTTLGLQFLYAGATKYGENGVYVSFVESVDKLMKNALSFGWDFKKLTKEKSVRFLDLMPSTQESSLEADFGIMLPELQSLGAKRIVIDSLTAMTAYIEKKAEARTFVGMVNRLLENAGCTSLLLVEVPWGESDIGSGFEEFLSDGLIVLESSLDRFRVRRMLYVPKMRGTNHDLNCYDFFISTDGIGISPIPTSKK